MGIGGGASALWAYVVFVCLNLIVVVGANVAYVYVAIYESSGVLLLAQLLLSTFKLVWSYLCTSVFIPWANCSCS